MKKRDDGRHLIKLADFIECAPSRWLPAAGYVKSFTFTLDEADQVASGLRLSAQQREPVVRVKELEWRRFSFDHVNHYAHAICGEYCAGAINGVGYFSQGDSITMAGSTLDDAKSAAQADYEQRIRAAIEIAPQSDRQPLPSQKQVSETGKELPKNTEQPMNNADVSVGELAGFFVTEFPHLLTMLTQIEVARALLARFRIERLDRLASNGRR